MKTLDFTTTINASTKKVWQVLWDDYTYPLWTKAFHEGSYAVSDWKEGSKIHFLSPQGDGMFSVIMDCKTNELMSFKHLGIIKAFKEQPENEETKLWGDAMEIYSLKEENGITVLKTSLNSIEQYEDYFKKTFPIALSLVKELAEKPVLITIETLIDASVEKVWEYWNEPAHIIKWNNASDDWHTTKAENNLTKGGKFLSRMEAKDGSFSFDFEGVYDTVKSMEQIRYTILDGRKVTITFARVGNKTKVIEQFEVETDNTIKLQQMGWQSILDNFKKYVELTN